MKGGFTNMWSSCLSGKLSTLSHWFCFTGCDSTDIGTVISLDCTEPQLRVTAEKQTSESSTFFFIIKLFKILMACLILDQALRLESAALRWAPLEPGVRGAQWL